MSRNDYVKRRVFDFYNHTICIQLVDNQWVYDVYGLDHKICYTGYSKTIEDAEDDSRNFINKNLRLEELKNKAKNLFNNVGSVDEMIDYLKCVKEEYGGDTKVAFNSIDVEYGAEDVGLSVRQVDIYLTKTRVDDNVDYIGLKVMQDVEHKVTDDYQLISSQKVLIIE